MIYFHWQCLLIIFDVKITDWSSQPLALWMRDRSRMVMKSKWRDSNRLSGFLPMKSGNLSVGSDRHGHRLRGTTKILRLSMFYNCLCNTFSFRASDELESIHRCWKYNVNSHSLWCLDVYRLTRIVSCWEFIVSCEGMKTISQPMSFDRTGWDYLRLWPSWYLQRKPRWWSNKKLNDRSETIFSVTISFEADRLAAFFPHRPVFRLVVL